jgi:hypothetical protein
MHAPEKGTASAAKATACPTWATPGLPQVTAFGRDVYTGR